MVSYFKTQWFKLAVALICLVISCVYAFQPAGDPSTIEGLEEGISALAAAGTWFLGFVVWSSMSMISYNEERIELLEKKAEKYEALCELVEALREANEVDRDFADHLNRKIDSFILEAEKARVKALEKYNTHEEIE